MIRDDERLDRVNENLQLIQKKKGLTFGTDAFLLYAYLKSKKNGFAVDLGAGTGIISLLALAKGKFHRVAAVEAQAEFAELIQRNRDINCLSDRLSVMHADVRRVTSADLEREADVVFTNPPYMTVKSGYSNTHEEKYIARHEVLGGINDFCRCAASLLKFGGSFYAVYRPDRLADLLEALRSNNLEAKRMTYVYADAEHPPSLVLVEAKKGGLPGLFVTKPLLLKDADGNNTLDIEYIYQNGVFHEDFTRP